MLPLGGFAGSNHLLKTPFVEREKYFRTHSYFSALIECDISAHFCPKFDYFVICPCEVDLQ